MFSVSTKHWVLAKWIVVHLHGCGACSTRCHGALFAKAAKTSDLKSIRVRGKRRRPLLLLRKKSLVRKFIVERAQNWIFSLKYRILKNELSFGTPEIDYFRQTGLQRKTHP